MDDHFYEGFTEPYQEIKVAASESGVIAHVNVQRGDVVAKGQELLKLDTSVLEVTLEAARLEAGTSAEIKILKIILAEKKHRLNTLRELSDKGASTVDELREAESKVKIAAQELQQALEKKEMKRLRSKEIETRIRKHRTQSPISGIVTDVTREIGEFVSLNDPHIATVVDLSKLKITFYLPFPVANILHHGQRVKIRQFDVDPTIIGVVKYIGVTREADTGRVRVDVEINNAQNQYSSGARCFFDRESLIRPSP